MDLKICVEKLRPDVVWVGAVNKYNLTTLAQAYESEYPIPTLSECEAVWVEISLTLCREKRCGEVEELLTEKYSIDLDYTYDAIDYEWQVDEGSQRKIGFGASVAIMSSIDVDNFPWVGDDTLWCSSNNTMVEFITALDFLQFAKAIQVHCRALWKNAKIHKTTIRSLTDETEINDYEITRGWE